MEIKRNEATRNRPAGDRIIDAPIVAIDLADSIRQLKEEKAWATNDKNGITVFKSSELAIVIVAIHKDAEIIENSVDGYMLVQVLSGRIRVQMEDRKIEIEKEQMVVLHPGIEHTITALDDTTLMLTNMQH